MGRRFQLKIIEKRFQMGHSPGSLMAMWKVWVDGRFLFGGL
jgi:hypothetical protein